MPFEIKHNVCLKSLNTFGINAQTKLFSKITNLNDLQKSLAAIHQSHLPHCILGSGSNILFTQNFEGWIIKNEIFGIDKISEDAKYVWLKVGAGENWHQLVLHCIQNNWGGIENLSLIPGTVGAAPIQNIGAYGVELQDVFFELEAMNIANGKIYTFDKTACEFGYRDSIFKHIHKDKYIILNITLKLNKHFDFNISYGAIKDTLAEMKIKNLTLKAISDAVIHIRNTKLPDPKKIGNAGSFFKNPIIALEKFNALKAKFIELPYFDVPGSHDIKIPAAWLIEQCGFKGKRFGEVGVHAQQPLVLINYGNGNGEALLNLAHQIQNSVKAKFDVTLIPEVNII